MNQPRQKRTRHRQKPAPQFAPQYDHRQLFTYGVTPVLVAVFTALAFFPSLQNNFVSWDDFETLILNPRYQGLGWTQLQWMFTTFLLGHYQPLSWVSWSIDYLLWGKDPFGFHLTNLLLHAANAILFYFISRRLLQRSSPGSAQEGYWIIPVAAAFAALVFAVHPLRVESVAWATERRDVLSAHFLLWTLIFYLHAVTIEEAGRDKWPWMAGALAFYLFSLLSKAIGMTLPVVLCILDFYPLRRWGGESEAWSARRARKLLLEKIPFAIPAMIFAVVAIFAQHYAGALSTLKGYPVQNRIGQAFYGIVFYIWKTLLPIHLSPLYGFPAVFNPLDLPFVASMVMVLAVTMGLFLLRRRWPAGFVAWVYYIVVLSPMLGLAQSGPQLVADRYTYLSCLSWSLLAGAVLLYALRRSASAATKNDKSLIVTGTAALVVIVLGLATWKQTQIWRNTETMWRQALAINPQSHTVHFYFANVLKAENKLPEAVDHYRQALRIDPDYTEVHYDFAQALATLGDLDQAIEHMRKYIAKAPPTAAAHIDLGIFLSRQGKQDEEMNEYREALKIDPKSAEANFGLGNVLGQRGELEEAKRYLMRAIELNSEKSEFYFSLGNLLVKQSLLPQATEAFRQAVRIKPDFLPARNNLGRLLAAQGDLRGAVENFREALRINPAFAPAHESLAQALAEMGMREEAMAHYQEAVRLMQAAAPAGAQP